MAFIYNHYLHKSILDKIRVYEAKRYGPACHVFFLSKNCPKFDRILFVMVSLNNKYLHDIIANQKLLPN